MLFDPVLYVSEKMAAKLRSVARTALGREASTRTCVGNGDWHLFQVAALDHDDLQWNILLLVVQAFGAAMEMSGDVSSVHSSCRASHLVGSLECL